MPKVEAIRDYELAHVDEDDVDFELPSVDQMTGPHIGLMPMKGAVQPTRWFYGARFFNQALPLVKPEAPWIQSQVHANPGQSFDALMGDKAGNIRAKAAMKITGLDDNTIHGIDEAGKKVQLPLYRNFAFNRKSGISNIPLVKVGDMVKPGDLLAHSNFTDSKGTLAMGINTRVGLVPYKGYSMDDAIVISEALAKRLSSLHTETIDADFKAKGLKGGLDHFTSIFPSKYVKEQLANMDPHGVVKVGTVLNKNDPVILASRPRNFNSSQSALGKLHKVARTLRADASTKWDNDDPGRVVDVAHNRDGTIKVVVESVRPVRDGDKLVYRSGQKGITSRVIPDAHMPRTADGRPLEVLLNPMGIPSRANSNLPLEVILGKIAEKTGQPMKLPSFNAVGDSWVKFAREQLAAHGLTDKEEVFDPLHNRKLENPITVGSAFIMKLHHTAESKSSSRGQAGYDANMQPSRGGGEGAQSKRLSGLETSGMLSSGAYANLREASTLRGQQNDQFWRSLRAGQTPKAPGAPFVFQKFRALLNGAGLHARDMSGGKLRLGLMTDKILDQYNPQTVKHGKVINFKTLAPETGGLFDDTLTTGNRWGAIDLPEPMPNPAAEEQIRHLLGLTRKDFQAVLAGEMDLPQISR